MKTDKTTDKCNAAYFPAKWANSPSSDRNVTHVRCVVKMYRSSLLQTCSRRCFCRRASRSSSCFLRSSRSCSSILRALATWYCAWLSKSEHWRASAAACSRSNRSLSPPSVRCWKYLATINRETNAKLYNEMRLDARCYTKGNADINPLNFVSTKSSNWKK